MVISHGQQDRTHTQQLPLVLGGDFIMQSELQLHAQVKVRQFSPFRILLGVIKNNFHLKSNSTYSRTLQAISINILPIMSKVVETVVKVQFTNGFELLNLLNNAQLGFRRTGLSTTIALLSLATKITV